MLTKNPKKMTGQTLQILGVRVTGTEIAEVLGVVRKKLARKEKFWIATPNPEMVVLAKRDPEFQRIINSADLAIPDGIGLVWAARILGRTLPKRVTGTDLMERLCQEGSKHGWSVYLIGGKPGVASAAAAKLKIKNSKLKIWAETGPALTLDAGRWTLDTKGKIKKIVEQINQKSPDLLFVAFGMGKQEKFIYDNLDKLNVKLAMVVGGAFDFISGSLTRAPLPVQKLGLEWLWRLIQEPWRIKRQLALGKFIFLVLKEKICLH